MHDGRGSDRGAGDAGAHAELVGALESLADQIGSMIYDDVAPRTEAVAPRLRLVELPANVVPLFGDRPRRGPRARR
jgi:hypothetical protein